MRCVLTNYELDFLPVQIRFLGSLSSVWEGVRCQLQAQVDLTAMVLRKQASSIPTHILYTAERSICRLRLLYHGSWTTAVVSARMALCREPRLSGRKLKISAYAPATVAALTSPTHVPVLAIHNYRGTALA